MTTLDTRPAVVDHGPIDADPVGGLTGDRSGHPDAVDLATEHPSSRLDHVHDDVTRRFVLGDDGSLRSVYDEYGSLIYSFCRRTLDDALAEEATQDVFVQAWRHRDRFDPERGSLAAWLVGIAKHRVIDRVRAERRHTDRAARLDHDPSGDVSVAPTTTTPDPIERLGDRMLVADALSQLDDRPKWVIELAYLGGLTHPEIAERTGIPIGTVKSDIRRGLERIRRFLETSND